MILSPNRDNKGKIVCSAELGMFKTSDQPEKLHQDYTYEHKNPSLVMRDHWDITPRTNTACLRKGEPGFALERKIPNIPIKHGIFDSQATKQIRQPIRVRV